MTHDEAFLADIFERPEDDAPRLVYADWLDEHGEPERAEFIRAQCERDRLPAGDARQSALQARERRLLVAHYGAWTAPYRGWKALRRDLRFRRGFVERLRGCEPAPFLAWADAVFGAVPLTDLGILTQQEGWGPNLADCPHLGRLRTLRLRARPDDLLAVCRSPHLGPLQTLDLRNNLTGDSALAELVGAPGRPPPPALRSLRKLVLHYNDLGDPGLSALAGSPLAHTLTGLDLSLNHPLTPAGLRPLPDSALWARLEELNLADLCRGTDAPARLVAEGLPRSRLRRLSLAGYPHEPVAPVAVAEALAGAGSWGALEALSLYLSRIGDDGLRVLLGCAHLAGLTALDLRLCDLGAAGVSELAGCPHAARLTTLRLGGNRRVGDEGVIALASSPHLGKLTYLDLAQTGVTDAGVATLARSPNVAHLRVLNLHPGAAGRVTDAGLRALAESPHLGRLTTLYLNVANGVTDSGVRALVDSPNLPCLTYLDFYPYKLSEVGQRALLRAEHLAWPGLDPHTLRSRGLRRAYRARFGDFVGRDFDWDEPFFAWEG